MNALNNLHQEHGDWTALSNDAVYIYGERQGKNVAVYVLDTGIEIAHENFDGRARWGYNDPALNPITEPISLVQLDPAHMGLRKELSCKGY